MVSRESRRAGVSAVMATIFAILAAYHSGPDSGREPRLDSREGGCLRQVRHLAPAYGGSVRKLVLGMLALLLLAACSSTAGVDSNAPMLVKPPPLGGKVRIEAHGLNVPWAAGGLREDDSGEIYEYKGDWPTVPVASLRVWDSRTAWLDLEPKQGEWNFSHLDAIVDKAKANGVSDILLVLAGTPPWAASKALGTDAFWMGAGSASMPTSLDVWREYVSKVAQRYAGRISAYEVGNEPNLLTFWNGTPDQYQTLVTSAASAIREADPSAMILVSGGLVRGAADVPRLAAWLAPLRPLVAANGIDGIALHYYPKARSLRTTPTVLQSLVRQLHSLGMDRLPRWITEINVTDGASMRSSDQAKAVDDLVTQTQIAGFERLYWYAWTDISSGTMIRFQPETEGEHALADLD